MVWSPDDAMKAYMQTLKLCREEFHGNSIAMKSSMVVEPDCVEFVSALAAGSGAQWIVEVASGGILPFTLALATAAKCTGGHLVCVRPVQVPVQELQPRMTPYGLDDVVHFEVGNPWEVVKKYAAKIDFAFIDRRRQLPQVIVFHRYESNSFGGTVVVVNNIFHWRSEASYGKLVKGREGVESVVLPIGKGMEVTRIGKAKEQKAEKKIESA